MTHPNEGLIHDFVDLELEATRRADIEAHLAGCARCRAEVESLRDLRRRAERAFAVESGAPPATDAADLWPGIEARILASRKASVGARLDLIPRQNDGAGRRARTIPRPARAAAAVAAIGLAAVAAYLAGRSTPSGREDLPLEAAGPAVPTTSGRPDETFAATVTSAYDAAFPELEAILEQGRETLAPETVSILETNLAVLNTAIREIQEALGSDPAQPEVIRSLNRMYELKVGLLQRAVLLSRGT